jgi:hypothetical protein
MVYNYSSHWALNMYITHGNGTPDQHHAVVHHNALLNAYYMRVLMWSHTLLTTQAQPAHHTRAYRRTHVHARGRHEHGSCP